MAASSRNESIQSLERYNQVVTNTRTLAAETATKLHQQGEQIGRGLEAVYEIDDMLKRAVAMAKHTARRAGSQKVLWVLIGLIAIIVINTTGGGDGDPDEPTSATGA